MNIDVIGKSDIETGKAVEVKIPPVPGQMELTTPEERKVYEMAGSDFNTAVPWAEGPRRMAGDKTGDYVWACDWWGGNLAKIDIHTLKVTIVPLPRPDAQEPYQAVVDKNHNVWTNIMGGDEVLRYDPKTSQWTEFPFPTLGAETRYVSILERGGSTEIILPYSRARKVARMRLRTRDADRLQRIGLIKRVGDLAGIRGDPVDWLVGDFGRHEIDGRRDRHWRTLADVSADRSRR